MDEENNIITEVLENTNESPAPLTVLPVWSDGEIIRMYEVRKPLSSQTKAPFAIV